jgi:hypothetical protein
MPLVSLDLNDLVTPGVVVELTPDEAEAEGLTIEDALTAQEAMDANDDLGEQE